MGVEPGFGLARAQVCHVPAALLGVAGERTVVDLEPRFLVDPGDERAVTMGRAASTMSLWSGRGVRISKSSRSSVKPSAVATAGSASPASWTQ